jgi:hypothetical protein
MLGGVSGQILGAQIGSRSIELSQIGTTLPLTHAQTQSAAAGAAKIHAAKAQKPKRM